MSDPIIDPPGIVRSVEALAELAGRINAEHHHVETALRAGLEHAKRAGDLLIDAKKQCKHGQWLPWLKANVRFTDRTARRYMELASRWDELGAKTDTVSDLSYRDAIALLSGPSAEDEAKAQRVADSANRLLRQSIDEMNEVLAAARRVEERLRPKIKYYPFAHTEGLFERLADAECAAQTVRQLLEEAITS